MRRNRLSVFVLFLTLLVAFCGRSAKGQTFTESTLWNFCSTGGVYCTDGYYPTDDAQLIQAADGNLWGVTSLGGVANSFNSWGTLFKVTPSGTYTVVHSFCSEGDGACTDGGIPKGGLVQGPDGNIYGTTYFTGAAGGTLFKATPDGTFTVIYTFCTSRDTYCSDGSYPAGQLIVGSDGNLYGVTSTGGANGNGTLYKMTLAGKQTVLANFPAGGNPQLYPSGPVEATDGNFYGVTRLGGGNNAVNGGDGSVWKLTPAGKYSTIYSFCSVNNDSYQCEDGLGPYGPGLVENSDGSLYGVTADGGTGNAGLAGSGLAFSVTTAGTESVVYDFCSMRNSNTSCADGGNPYGGIYLAGDGKFYGGTSYGGPIANAGGVVYQLGSVIYTFPCDSNQVCTDGSYVVSPPIQDSNGTLYGTTEFGGTGDQCACGVIYKLKASPPLPAPVQVTLNPATVAPNSSTTLSWKALNAFSNTMQQCYAFVQGGATGAGTWTGKQTGSYSSGTKLFTGSATITPTKAGTYTYALTCGGVESGFATLTVSGTSKDTSTTTLTATPNPATVGQSVSLKATVTGSGGTPTGSVSYAVTTVELGSKSLASGVATLTASSNGQAPGTYPVVATYGGSSTYDGSSSKAVNVTLKKAPTATTLTASPTLVTPPGDVTLTATVKRTGSGVVGVPTGTVSFTVEGLTLGTVKVNGSGVATLKASSAGVAGGQYPVKAVYNGDASDVSSMSSAVTVTVK